MNEIRNIHEPADQLARYGFVYLPALCPNDFAQQVLEVSRERIRDVRSALGDREIGIGSAAGFEEVVQRSPKRWDVQISPEQLGTRMTDLPWWPLIAAILGEDAKPSFSGIVYSEPGSPAQHWHIDSPHVASDHREAHALNVMVALHDIPKEMGPTEIARGSHKLTNHLRNPDLVRDELVYQHAGTSPEVLVEGTRQRAPEPWARAMTAGSCLIFDDRILHRGLANHSDRTRYIGYFAYRRKTYTENTHFEAERSVFDTRADSSAA